MGSRSLLETAVFSALRDNGMSSVAFRNAVRLKAGLNVVDSECLSYLSIKGTATPTELARYSGLSTGATTAMLDRLEKVGFVRRSRNAEDRRGVVVQVDQKWLEVSAPLVAGVQAAHRELIGHYTDDQLRTIADFLAQFTKNIIHHTHILEQSIFPESLDYDKIPPASSEGT